MNDNKSAYNAEMKRRGFAMVILSAGGILGYKIAGFRIYCRIIHEEETK